MLSWWYAIVSVVLVSAVSLVGVATLSLGKETLKRVSLLLVGFATGSLFGDAFIHLLPESFAKLGSGLGAPFLVLSGIFLFFILEKFVRWRHCHVPDCEEHPHPVVAVSLVGDTIHNVVDGLMIGASYLVGLPLGVATTIAIVAHEIPQELSDFGIYIHGGLSVRKALVYNIFSGAAAVVGTLAALALGAWIKDIALILLPITAGGFIYIAGADLIPELHHNFKISTSLWQLLAMALGVGSMALLTLLG